jgi:hypothetical protein
MADTRLLSQPKRARRALLAPLLIGVCLTGAVACGSSSTNPTSSTTATTAAITTTSVARTVNPAAAAAYRAKLNAYASCMTANGVHVAPATTGPNGIPAVGAPAQVSHQQLLAALRKCRKVVVAALEAHHSIVAP